MTHDTQIIERLARVEEKIDNFLTRVMDQVDRSNDHEGRIRKLEAGNQHLLGVGAVIVIILTVLGSNLASMIF